MNKRNTKSYFIAFACLALTALLAVPLDALAYRGHGGRHHHRDGFHFSTHYWPSINLHGGLPYHHYPVYRQHNSIEVETETAGTHRLFAYPNNGQNEAQQARDKFECYNWAVNESGFDPVQAAGAGGSVTRTVRPNNPGPSDPITGAAGGAALGAIGGAIAGDPGIGAAIGAAVGGTVGLANEVDESSRTTVVTSSAPAAGNPQEYQRAMTACLVARGYTVR